MIVVGADADDDLVVGGNVRMNMSTHCSLDHNDDVNHD